ncbi:sugar ABC transporter permease [Nisaea sp.]|uniref:carbohydrate ABC transporter permease n=1 Tax=Nisaea sp. TaxID=2024842 RepID=UPI003263F14B
MAPTRADAARAAMPQMVGRRKPMSRDRQIGLLLLVPLVVLVIGLTAYPILQVIQLAFQQQSLYSQEASFNGLANFEAVIGHEGFTRSVKNTFVFTFGSLALQMALGLPIAILLSKEFPMRAPIRGVMLFSYLVPYVVAAMTWKFMFSDATGILNYWVRALSLPMPASPFGSLDWSMAGVILVNSWKNFPFMVIVFLAQLQTIDQQLYEAASVDGATAWQKFCKITLPSLIPIMLVVGMLRTIWNFNNFEVVFLLTQGGPIGRTETLPLYIYRFVFGEFSLGRGAALAVIVFFVLLIMSLIYWRLYERTQEQFK